MSQTVAISGSNLLIIAVVLALVPILMEVISDGGPSRLGDPETGWTMVETGFFMWPVALILFLIGKKGLISVSTSDTHVNQPAAPKVDEAKPIAMTDAWSELNKSDKGDNK
jgi:hypothetical protein